MEISTHGSHFPEPFEFSKQGKTHKQKPENEQDQSFEEADVSDSSLSTHEKVAARKGTDFPEWHKVQKELSMTADSAFVQISADEEADSIFESPECKQLEKELHHISQELDQLIEGEVLEQPSKQAVKEDKTQKLKSNVVREAKESKSPELLPFVIGQISGGARGTSGLLNGGFARLDPHVQSNVLEALGEMGTAGSIFALSREFNALQKAERSLAKEEMNFRQLEQSGKMDKQSVEAEREKLNKKRGELKEKQNRFALTAGLNAVSITNSSATRIAQHAGTTLVIPALGPSLGLAGVALGGTATVTSIYTTLQKIQKIDEEIAKIEQHMGQLEGRVSKDSPLMEALSLKLYYLKKGAKENLIGSLIKDTLSLLSTSTGAASSAAALLSIKMMVITLLGPVGAGIALAGLGVGGILFYRTNKVEIQTMISKLPENIDLIRTNKKMDKLLKNTISKYNKSAKDIEANTIKFSDEEEKIKKYSKRVAHFTQVKNELKEKEGFLGSLMPSGKMQLNEEALFKNSQKLQRVQSTHERTAKNLESAKKVHQEALQNLNTFLLDESILKELEPLLKEKEKIEQKIEEKDQLGARRKEAHRWGVSLSTTEAAGEIDRQIKLGYLRKKITEKAPELLRLYETNPRAAAQLFYGADPYSKVKALIYKMVSDDKKGTLTEEEFRNYFKFYHKDHPELLKNYKKDPGGTLANFVLENP